VSSSVAFFVIAVVLIGCATGLISDYLKTRRKELEQGGTIHEYESRIETLEERIRVLERIVTEKEYDLKKEINEL
jgi:hypothetical protein